MSHPCTKFEGEPGNDHSDERCRACGDFWYRHGWEESHAKVL